MFGHDAISQDPFSAVPAVPGGGKVSKADPFRKDYRKALKARTKELLAAKEIRESQWAAKLEAKQSLRKSIVRAMHPEQIASEPITDDDEADVEFLLLNS